MSERGGLVSDCVCESFIICIGTTLVCYIFRPVLWRAGRQLQWKTEPEHSNRSGSADLVDVKGE
jgi:hypothetical protein